MANADTRQSFWVDSELWQPPGENKLRWWERKLAIYLRKVAGVFEADGEVHPHAVLKAVSTMAAATGLSENKVRLAIARLRSWPKDDPFITDEDQILLRPLPAKKVRIAMWLWAAPLPDDWKDVLWFIRSQFITKDDRGEIFRCAIKGRRMPSILRCCYVSGVHWKARGKRVHRLLGWMAKAGMTEVVKPATSKSAALVLIHDEAPTEKVKKLCEYYATQLESVQVIVKTGGTTIRGGDQDEHYSQVVQSACRVASKTVSGGQQEGVGWPAKPCRVASKGASGGHVSVPFSGSSSQCPSTVKRPTHPADAADQGGQGISLGDKIVDRLHDPLGLLRFCSEQTGLARGRLEWEQIATRLLRLLRSIQEASAECLDDLLVSDLVVALASDRWNGLDPVMAIRFADKFKGRLVELILEQLGIRQAAAARELQKQRERDPEYRFQQALNRGCEFRSECPCNSYDALLHLIWHTLPQHKHLFRDRYRNGLVFDVPKPSGFLTEQDKQELYPLWLSVDQAGDADSALQAIIDKHERRVQDGRRLGG